jgi:hypothetical protein
MVRDRIPYDGSFGTYLVRKRSDVLIYRTLERSQQMNYISVSVIGGPLAAAQAVTICVYYIFMCLHNISGEPVPGRYGEMIVRDFCEASLFQEKNIHYKLR